MAIFPGSAIPSAVSDYEIDNSLRFDDGDSAYLTKTDYGAGNRTSWTWSGWTKFSQTTTQPALFSWQVDGSPNHRTSLDTGNSDLNFANYTGSYAARIVTNAKYRDPGAWYHVVAVWDTDNATEGDRLRLYVNGERVTSLGTETYPTSGFNSVLGDASGHFDIGQQGDGSQYMDGYLAEVYFIDGQSLTAASFGELDSDTNQWKPLDSDDVKDAVTFGTNGFFQKYNSTELAASFADSYNAGGGGGAGAAGGAASTSVGGAGGIGKAYTIADGTTSVYYAGGGGGAGTGGPAAGGSGGGGAGSNNGTTAPGAGTANTGGGAGGGGHPTGTYVNGAAGGSGVLIIYDGTTRTTFTSGRSAHTITANGDATNQRPQPHDVTANGDAHLIGPKQGSSTFFINNGATSNLSMADSADWMFGTGDFTLEMWVNTTKTGVTQYLMGQIRTDGTDECFMRIDTAGTWRLGFVGASGGIALESTSSVPKNTWTHLAIVRDGTTFRLYTNGVQEGINVYGTGSQTEPTSVYFVGAVAYIASGGDGAPNDGYYGYMDGVRISKGVCRYPDGTTFTPPTTAFVSDSQTVFLLQSGADGSGTFTDTGNTDHTITANGDVRWFAPKVGAGAMAFDGTGDYFTVPDNTNWSVFSAGDRTFEGWFKLTDYSVAKCLFSQYEDASNKWEIAHNGAGGGANGLEFGLKSGGSWVISSGYASSSAGGITDVNWHHIALVKSGTTYTMYLDGTALSNTVTTATTDELSSVLYIGNNGAGGAEVEGYADMIRISQRARYTGSFTPSTTAFTDDINTSLLLNADINQGTWAEDTSTGLAISTDSRMKFDGTGDYLSIADQTFQSDVELWTPMTLLLRFWANDDSATSAS
jgi:hypothetical protein